MIYIDVIQAYERLELSISALKNALLTESQLAAWLQDGLSPHLAQLSHRERAGIVISALEYDDDQAPKEILICAGLIGASKETLTIVETVNQAKEQFKKTILMLKKDKVNLSTATKRENTTSAILKKIGLSRLHLKQCYRKLPVLTEAPLKVTWTWAHIRSIRKITKENARELLIKRSNDMGIQYQLQNLERLSHHEPLAIIQELAPHLRANILFKNQKRLMVKGPVPIFFPANNSSEFPLFKPPGPKKAKDKNRMIRADLQIDPEPFLPAIHAHRYLEFSKK